MRGGKLSNKENYILFTFLTETFLARCRHYYFWLVLGLVNGCTRKLVQCFCVLYFVDFCVLLIVLLFDFLDNPIYIYVFARISMHIVF